MWSQSCAHQCAQEDFTRVLSFSSSHLSLNLIICFFLLFNECQHWQACNPGTRKCVFSCSCPAKVAEAQAMRTTCNGKSVFHLPSWFADKTTCKTRINWCQMWWGYFRSDQSSIHLFSEAMGWLWTGGSFLSLSAALISLINWAREGIIASQLHSYYDTCTHIFSSASFLLQSYYEYNDSATYPGP